MPSPSLSKLLLLALVLLTLTGCSVRHALRVEDRELIDVQTMIGELGSSSVVFVGERHDTSTHHRLQLKILEALQTSGRPLAIGMEMFEDLSQGTLNAWSSGNIQEGAFRRVFEDNWRNIPWGLYRDILLFARDHRIPVIGLNPPRNIVRKVSQQGFSSLTGREFSLLPAGITAEVDDRYLEFLSSAYSLHGARGESFRYIAEAQMLRNRVMARHIGTYLSRHPETVMVVITGGVHARGKGGIPSELGNISYKIILPPLPKLDAHTVSTGDADYLLEEPWLSEAP